MIILDEDEIQEFLRILKEEPDGIFAHMVRTCGVPNGVPADRPDVAAAIAALKATQ